MKTEKQKKKNKEYMREYNDRPDIKIRHKKYMKKYNERPEVKKDFKEYMKKYSKKPSERAKKLIRMQSQRIYGKVPSGHERHHINYDSPHNFILVKNVSKEKTDHPCQMPLEVMKRIIGILPEDYIIIDPFAGSGTTALACKELGREFIMVESDEKYVEIINERLKNCSPNLKKESSDE